MDNVKPWTILFFREKFHNFQLDISCAGYFTDFGFIRSSILDYWKGLGWKEVPLSDKCSWFYIGERLGGFSNEKKREGEKVNSNEWELGWVDSYSGENKEYLAKYNCLLTRTTSWNKDPSLRGKFVCISCISVWCISPWEVGSS